MRNIPQEKRKERSVSLRKFAEQVGISPVYLSNLTPKLIFGEFAIDQYVIRNLQK